MSEELSLLYVHGTAIGYGRMGVKMADALQRQGVTIYDQQDDPIALHELTTNDGLLRRGVDPITHRAEPPDPARMKRTKALCWMSVPTHAKGWWAGQVPTIFTMWEAMELPPSFRENLHEFDRIFVPSHQNKELFSQYHDDVRFVPLGIDPDEWHYIPREPGSQFRFLIGGSGPRKGCDLAFTAFQTVFGKWWKTGVYTGPKDQPVPMLVMKNPRGETDYRAPFVEMHAGRLTDEEERSVYASAHVYLQPSRGEGFGLQPLQAIAQGMPTILTAAHGHDSFADLGIPLDWKPEPASYFIYGDAGNWWEPDFDQLCEAMWDTYNDYDRHLRNAKVSSDYVTKTMRWEDSARLLRTEMADILPADPVAHGSEWHQPVSKKYRLRVNRVWVADIAGVSYRWEPGNDYWESADVKRILFEGNILDPECLEGPDTGLLPQQVEKFPAYTAAHSFCPSCNQQYNSGISRADVEMTALESA